MTPNAGTTTARSRTPGGLRGFIAHPATPFLLPAVAYLALLTLFPFIYNVILSTTRNNLARPNQSGFVGIGNYVDLFTDRLFQISIGQTFLVAAGSIALELVVGFLVARLFFSVRDMPGSNVVRTVYILPMMLTPVVSGLLWNYILNPTLGIANYLLASLGLPALTWFSSGDSALLTLILVNSWQWGPFLMLLMLAGLMSVPKEHYEAAALDGARWWHVVRWIELPAIRDVLLIGVILRLIENFRLFDVVYAATKGGPGTSTEVVSMYAFRQIFQFFNIGYGAAVSVVILFIGVLLTTFAVRLLRREEARVR
jgi:multiple sugar transport system permease protein